MESKFKQWKETLKNVPPERLLRVNLQGFALQTIGLIIACTMIVITRDIPWWLIFAFGFGIFNTISGFISTYQQYVQLLEIKKELNLFKEDKSPHRNKAKQIKDKFGLWPGWISFFFSALLIYISFDWVVNLKWYSYLLRGMLFFIFYYVIYFKIFFNLTKSGGINGTQTD